GDGEGEGDPFAGIRMALAAEATSSLAGHTSSLADIPLGPRTSHAPARGAHTLLAYRQWVARAGSTPEGVPGAFLGEPSWTPERRFERVFERLALPGFARMGRYELLVTLGRLAVYPLRPATLALVAARASGGEDPTLLAAKRVFGIGDSQLMERRALALAQALEIPLDALELALANWEASQRATLGFPAHIEDLAVRARAQAALGL
ncbi:MAG TPA: hypothetical protein VMG62_02025, partial [Solirubrobacteraceae bacterium]|nr:hypothetical protein [Solirubrobacteraceae bacterium]